MEIIKGEGEVEHIKLRVEDSEGQGETFWAIKLTENTAKVDNILLNEEVGLHDIVLFDEDHNVLEVIQKVTTTTAVKYPAEGDIEETWKTLREYIREKGLSIEGMFKGTALISIPVEMSDEEYENIIDNCPVKLEFFD